MSETKEIVQGSTVAYNGGYYRVSARFKKTVNLARIFEGSILHKSIPVSEVKEAYDDWSDVWSKSESYRCM